MKKSILLIAVILVAYAFLSWFNMNFVLTLDNMSVIYGDEDLAKTLYDSTHKLWIVSLVSAVFLQIVKVLFYSLVVYLGYRLFDKQKFAPIFQAVVGAEFVNVVGGAVKCINLAFVNPPVSQISTTLTPFSLMSFFDANAIEAWKIVPLNAVNVFEVLYIVVLTCLLGKSLGRTFGKSFKVVLLSYVLVTVLYVAGSTGLAVLAGNVNKASAEKAMVEENMGKFDDLYVYTSETDSISATSQIADNEKLLMVFYHQQCVYCPGELASLSKMDMPDLAIDLVTTDSKEMTDEFLAKYDFSKFKNVNVVYDTANVWHSALQINAHPATMYFKNGKLCNKHIGYAKMDEIIKE